jgi:uncharacterized damage-inducible protein DinB
MNAAVMTALLLLGLLSAPASGQTPATMSAFLRTRWVASSAYTRAIAEQMSAADYQFRPSPEQMTFGEQLLHIAEQDVSIFREMGAQIEFARPSPVKDEVLRTLEKVKDDGLKLLARLAADPDGSLDTLNGLLLALDHTTHHRGQLVVYLRLKGIVPAEYRR